MTLNQVLEACLIALLGITAAVMTPSANAQQRPLTALEVQQQMNYQREVDRRAFNQQQFLHSQRDTLNSSYPQPYTPLQQSQVAPVMLDSNIEALADLINQRWEASMPRR